MRNPVKICKVANDWRFGNGDLNKLDSISVPKSFLIRKLVFLWKGYIHIYMCIVYIYMYVLLKLCQLQKILT